jgi:hypothetical protein
MVRGESKAKQWWLRPPVENRMSLMLPIIYGSIDTVATVSESGFSLAKRYLEPGTSMNRLTRLLSPLSFYGGPVALWSSPRTHEKVSHFLWTRSKWFFFIYSPWPIRSRRWWHSLLSLRSLTISLRKVDTKSQNRLNIAWTILKKPSKEIIKNLKQTVSYCKGGLKNPKEGYSKEIDVSQPLLLLREAFFTQQEKVTTNSPFCLCESLLVSFEHTPIKLRSRKSIKWSQYCERESGSVGWLR